jgi:3-hydroxyacyl-[acyl-carrier-protein] dehydratase
MLDHARISNILPHAHPMVLVDRIVSLDPGASIVGLKAISGSEPCYRHLPRDLPPARYAYPISLLIESFGQTAAILWLESVREQGVDPGRLLMLTVLRNLRIQGRAYPGEVLRHVVRLHIVGDNALVEGESWVESRRITTVESIVAAVRPQSTIFSRTGAASPTKTSSGFPPLLPTQPNPSDVYTVSGTG